MRGVAPMSKTAPVRPTVSVLVSSYNYAAFVVEAIESVLAQTENALEIIIVDDGSKDDTLAIARAIDDPRVRVFAQPFNMGKGAALRRAFQEATCEYVVVQDADLEYDPRDFSALLQPLLDGKADAVFGSRFTGHSRRVRTHAVAARRRACPFTRKDRRGGPGFRNHT